MLATSAVRRQPVKMDSVSASSLEESSRRKFPQPERARDDCEHYEVWDLPGAGIRFPMICFLPATAERPPRDGRDRRSVDPREGDRVREPPKARTGSHPGADKPFRANRTPRQYRPEIGRAS